MQLTGKTREQADSENNFPRYSKDGRFHDKKVVHKTERGGNFVNEPANNILQSLYVTLNSNRRLSRILNAESGVEVVPILTLTTVTSSFLFVPLCLRYVTS